MNPKLGHIIKSVDLKPYFDIESEYGFFNVVSTPTISFLLE